MGASSLEFLIVKLNARKAHCFLGKSKSPRLPNVSRKPTDHSYRGARQSGPLLEQCATCADVGRDLSDQILCII